MNVLGRVSWFDNSGDRQFGTFVQWDGDFAKVRKGPTILRIHKSNLTFEVG